jgi:hypothetical protein
LSVKIPLSDDLAVRPELTWDPAQLAEFPWLEPFLEVPENASPPLFMSPPTEDAVGSYGAEAITWIEAELKLTLRWWQRLAIVRQLERREDGSLTWRAVVESCPRRAGKSVRIRGLALWRQAHATLFGERQEIVHTGSDLAVCRKVQKDGWRWAEARDWTVMRANGKEAIESPDGDTWLVRAQSAVYGWDTTLGIVDEGWDVSVDAVSEGLEPSLLERIWPQLHLTSTSHRRATSLMKTRIRDALTTDDGETLLMLWAAPAGADPGDPAVWRAASPHWTEDRRRMIADKFGKALAGQADPAADDPDPLQGFLAQYLNVWRLRSAAAERGDPVVSEDDWSALTNPVPGGPPDAAAVESWFGDGVSLALAWKVDGRVVVSVQALPDLGELLNALNSCGYEGTVKVGASLLDDPALKGLRTDKAQGRTGTAVQELQRLIAEDVFRHDGGQHLTGQVLAARTMPGADGPRMASNAAADAIKAAVWAATAGRRPTRSALVVL